MKFQGSVYLCSFTKPSPLLVASFSYKDHPHIPQASSSQFFCAPPALSLLQCSHFFPIFDISGLDFSQWDHLVLCCCTFYLFGKSCVRDLSLPLCASGMTHFYFTVMFYYINRLK